MRLRIVFLVLALLNPAQPQATVCLATYGPDSTSAPALGLDFRILVIAAPNSVVRCQEVSSVLGYLDSDGQIQSPCQNSSIFHLASGLLSSGEKQISVRDGVPSSRFSTSDSIQALDRIFAVATDGTLVWNNEDFDEGNARFGADSKGIVYGIYSGSMPSNYTTVILKVMDTSECPDVPDNATLSTFPALFFSPSMTVGPTAQSQPVPPDTTSLPSLKGPRVPDRLTSSSLINVSTSFLLSVTNPTSSSASTSFMASGSFPASRNMTTSVGLTTSADLTASIPSFTSPLLPSDARSTIISNCWYNWCNDLLGTTANQAGAPIFFSTMNATTIAKDVPSGAVTITVTPTLTTTISDVYIDTATTITEILITEILTTTITPTYSNPSALASAMRKLRVRQGSNSTLSTPPALQSYDPDSLSSACSALSNHSTTISCIHATIVSTTRSNTILYISNITTQPFILNSTITTSQNTTQSPNSTALISTTAPFILISTIIPPQNTTQTPNSTTLISTGTTITLLSPFSFPTTSTTQTLSISSTLTTTPSPTFYTTLTTTLTTTSTATLLSPTYYPKCANLTTSLHGYGITIIDDSPNVVTSLSTPNAKDCCVACQTTPLCGGMYWIDGKCALVLAEDGECNPRVAVGSFEALSMTPVGEGYTLSNGTCGMLVHVGVQS